MTNSRTRIRIFRFFTEALLVICLFGISNAQDYVPDQLVCRVNNLSYIDSVNAAYGTEFVSYVPEIYTYLIRITDGADPDSLAQFILASDSSVLICEPNYYVDVPEGVQSSSPFLDEFTSGDIDIQPSKRKLKLSGAHQSSTGAQVKVGIVDGGIDLTHFDLAQVVNSRFDYIDGDTIANDEPGGTFSGHGTFVAGIVHLTAPDADLYSYRVLDTSGRGDGFHVADAIVQATNDSCRVINLSLAMHTTHAAMKLAIEYARQYGAVVVAAAGNDSANVALYPARDTNVVCVASVDTGGILSDFSNFGSHVDVCAPGTDILSTYPSDQFAQWRGTSFATPFATGVFALICSIEQAATRDEMVDATMSTATPIDSINPAQAGMLGAGLINPPAALMQFGGFVCGDINQDFEGPDISDLTALITYMFKGGSEPSPLASADVNGSQGEVDIADLTSLIEYMFDHGPSLNCSHQ